MAKGPPRLPGAQADTASKGLGSLAEVIDVLSDAAIAATKRIGQAVATSISSGQASKAAGDALAKMGSLEAKSGAIIDKFFGGLLTITSIAANLTMVVGIALSAVKNILQSIVAVFSIVGSIFNVLKSIAQSIFNVIKAVFNAILNVLHSIWSSFISLLGKIQSAFGTAVKYTLGGIAAIGVALIGAATAASYAWDKLNVTIQQIGVTLGNPQGVAGLREFANTMRRATTESTADMLKLIAAAIQLRIPEDRLKSIAAASVGLAAALGITEEAALNALNKGLRGNMDALKDLIPQLHGVSDQSERLAIVQRIANQGMDIATAKVSTLGGAWKQFKNVLADNAQKLGEAIAPGMKRIIDSLRPILVMLESSGQGFADVFNALAEKIAPAIETVIGYLQILHAGFFAAVDEIQANWKFVWELIVLTIASAALSIRGVVVHLFTVTIPAYFNWFIENAKNWVSALGEGLKTGFINMFWNLASVTAIGLRGILATLRGDEQEATAQFNMMGMGWHRSLTEGFKNAGLTELPTIAGRQVQAIETAIKERIAHLSGRLGADWGDRFDAKLEDLRNKLKGAAAAAKDEIGNLAPLPDEDNSKGKSGGTSTHYESRFLMTAPTGLAPAEIIAKEQLEQAKQAAAARARQEEATKQMNAKLDALEKTLIGIQALFAGGA